MFIGRESVSVDADVACDAEAWAVSEALVTPLLEMLITESPWVRLEA